MAEEALTRNLTGEEIIVLGAGLVGCETAEFFLAQGKKVTVIEQLPEAGAGLEPITRKVLLRRLNEKGP